jgi:hypothetical protein
MQTHLVDFLLAQKSLSSKYLHQNMVSRDYDAGEHIVGMDSAGLPIISLYG